MIGFLLLSWILGQGYYWLFLQPNAQKSADLYFDACVYPGGRNA